MSTKVINPQTIRESMGNFWGMVHRALVGCDGTTKVINLALLGGGHANLVGVPGTGKSLMAEAMAAALGGKANIFSFTADMMPSDIIGSEVFDPETQKMIAMLGYIDPDNHFTLADEYNRAPEKTMSAFMEPMQTGRLRIGRQVKQVKSPFFMIAVKNPVEQGGTYPTPEAMMDRFMATSVIGYTTFNQMVKMASSTNLVQFNPIEASKVEKALDPADLEEYRNFVRDNVVVPESVAAYIARLVAATRPADEEGSSDEPWLGEEYDKWMPSVVTVRGKECKVKDEGVILVGASNRAILALAALAKANAVMDGRVKVEDHDVKSVAVAALAHRITPNKQKTHKYPQSLMRIIVKNLLEKVPTVL